ncbi:MAG: hypothetical protein ABUS54_10260 [Actinomycetota bacterium]
MIATSLGPARPGDELELLNGEWRELYDRGEVEPIGDATSIEPTTKTPAAQASKPAPKRRRLRKSE